MVLIGCAYVSLKVCSWKHISSYFQTFTSSLSNQVSWSATDREEAEKCWQTDHFFFSVFHENNRLCKNWRIKQTSSFRLHWHFLLLTLKVLHLSILNERCSTLLRLKGVFLVLSQMDVLIKLWIYASRFHVSRGSYPKYSLNKQS